MILYSGRMTVGVGSLRRRLGLIGFLLAIPFIVVLLVSPPDLSSENALAERLADLQARLQHLGSLHRARREEIQVLSHHLAQFLNSQSENTTLRTLDSVLNPELRLLLRNLTGVHGAVEFPSPLKLPSVYYFLPHLLENPSGLRLGYHMSKGRTGVSMVLGIPSVKRGVQTYLLSTLRDLIDSMNVQELADTLIVVLIAETDMDYVMHVASQIEVQFAEHVESGLIDVIAPHPSFYPDLSNLRMSFGDSRERVKWRSKQNLDIAFLMMYCQPKGTFYVQLEDDILAKKNCVTTMKSFALEKIAKKDPWFVLVFCQLGFIGKMFKCVELPVLIQFFIMFYRDKPVDWLIDDLLTTKICAIDQNPKQCKRSKSELWVSYNTSLFQHVGTHSSLKGKVQKLKDKKFGKIPLYFPHLNPPATVESNIKSYKQYTLERAYNGDTFFWGLVPQPGDMLTFTFDNPIEVKGYLFRSGNAEYPSDKFFDTTVEVLPGIPGAANATSDGFIVVGEFNSAGIARGNLSMGKIKALRLHVHGGTDKWAILSEIKIEEMKQR